MHIADGGRWGKTVDKLRFGDYWQDLDWKALPLGEICKVRTSNWKIGGILDSEKRQNCFNWRRRRVCPRGKHCSTESLHSDSLRGLTPAGLHACICKCIFIRPPKEAGSRAVWQERVLLRKSDSCTPGWEGAPAITDTRPSVFLGKTRAALCLASLRSSKSHRVCGSKDSTWGNGNPLSRDAISPSWTCVPFVLIVLKEWK